jgi:hypothetical protein
MQVHFLWGFRSTSTLYESKYEKDQKKYQSQGINGAGDILCISGIMPKTQIALGLLSASSSFSSLLILPSHPFTHLKIYFLKERQSFLLVEEGGLGLLRYASILAVF